MAFHWLIIWLLMSSLETCSKYKSTLEKDDSKPYAPSYGLLSLSIYLEVSLEGRVAWLHNLSRWLNEFHCRSCWVLNVWTIQEPALRDLAITRRYYLKLSIFKLPFRKGSRAKPKKTSIPVSSTKFGFILHETMLCEVISFTSSACRFCLANTDHVIPSRKFCFCRFIRACLRRWREWHFKELYRRVSVLRKQIVQA